jgi:hypothetical protein
LEELRPLYPQEFNFRKIIKVHIANLLRMQNQYWRQRFTQRMTQFGDENTNFFHSMATGRFMKNVISQIMDDTGRMVSSHEEKRLYSGMNSEEDWVYLFTLICSLTFKPLSNGMITLKICVALSLQKKLIMSFLISLVIKLLALMALTILLSKNVGPLLDVTCIS